MFAVTMVAINAFGNTGSEAERQTLVTLHAALSIIMCLVNITNRPYRTFSSNMLNILCSLGYTQMVITMYMKV